MLWAQEDHSRLMTTKYRHRSTQIDVWQHERLPRDLKYQNRVLRNHLERFVSKLDIWITRELNEIYLVSSMKSTSLSLLTCAILCWNVNKMIDFWNFCDNRRWKMDRLQQRWMEKIMKVTKWTCSKHIKSGYLLRDYTISLVRF